MNLYLKKLKRWVVIHSDVTLAEQWLCDYGFSTQSLTDFYPAIVAWERVTALVDPCTDRGFYFNEQVQILTQRPEWILVSASIYSVPPHVYDLANLFILLGPCKIPLKVLKHHFSVPTLIRPSDILIDPKRGVISLSQKENESSHRWF
jgi:hypothetical protein